MYHYRESGLDNVMLVNGYRIEQDDELGELLTIDNPGALHRAIAWGLLHRRQALNGAEMKFLRTHLDLSQAAVARYLASNEQSVAKWEKAREHPVSNPPAERLFRAICAVLMDGETELKALLTTPPLRRRSGFAPVTEPLRLHRRGEVWVAAA